MPTCQNCGKEWSWKQILKQSFTLDTGMKCPHCKEKQYLTAKSRKRSAFSVFFIPLPLLFSPLFDIPPITTVILIFVVGLVSFGIYPWFVELSNEEESLW